MKRGYRNGCGYDTLVDIQIFINLGYDTAKMLTKILY